MSTDSTQDKKILELFMDDALWLKKIKAGRKNIEGEQRIDEKPAIVEQIADEKVAVKESINEASSISFGEVDYAILKSVSYGFKSITDISKALQIRTIVIEKHIYELIKDGFIKCFQYCMLTSKGKDAIRDFEKNVSVDTWKPIDEFIVSVIEHKKEQSSKIQKMIDKILLICVVILIILIIYFGIFS